jgi:hypothetical protein
VTFAATNVRGGLAGKGDEGKGWGMRFLGMKAARWAVVGVALVTLVVAEGASATPADPDATPEVASVEGSGAWSPIRSVADSRGRRMQFRWIYGDCGYDVPYISPGTQIWMKEIGVSGTTQLRAKIMWQQWDEFAIGGARWVTTLQRTYRSGLFANDNQSFFYRTPFHRFGPFVGAGRLAVKFTASRPLIRDLNFTQVVATCTSDLRPGT